MINEEVEDTESQDDIDADIMILLHKSSPTALSVNYKALVFSQLFEVKLRNGTQQLSSLAELTKLKNYKQSFVSYHDKGNNI